ncbi:hypothetical protein D3C79_996420 [compost metagenome]
MEGFTGAAMAADFQVGQVTHFAQDRAGVGLARVHFAHPLTAAVVDVALAIVFTLFPYNGPDFPQLISQIPDQ